MSLFVSPNDTAWMTDQLAQSRAQHNKRNARNSSTPTAEQKKTSTILRALVRFLEL